VQFQKVPILQQPTVHLFCTCLPTRAFVLHLDVSVSKSLCCTLEVDGVHFFIFIFDFIGLF
jgi:hypothetical protein